jgi:hypothetical protein
VQLDIFHAFKRLPVSTDHPASASFHKALKKAFFILNQDDVDAVLPILRSLHDGADSEFNMELAMERRHKWCLKRIRRHVPPPEQLISRLQEVFKSYGNTVDDFGRKFFSDAAWKEAAQILHHAQMGCLSDCPSKTYYVERGMDHNGLTLWRCLRSTSTLEGGVHQKLSSRFKGWRLSPRLFDALVSNFRQRFNIRAMIRNEPGFKNIGHYEHQDIAMLQELTTNLYGEPMFDWWLNGTKMNFKVREQFGFTPIIPESLYEVVSEEDVKDYPPDIAFLAKAWRMKVITQNYNFVDSGSSCF